MRRFLQQRQLHLYDLTGQYNKLVLEISNDKTKCKTFTSYINDIWKECMENSDKCVMTGKKPAKKEK